jgi:hypothetical protein
MADKPKGETIINEARELLDESQQGSGYNRENAESDIRFARLSEQWPDEVRKLRMEEGRPCLTINRLPTLIRQVVNDSRQAKPGIKVAPVDNGADEDTAEVISGLIRSIERNGDGAEVAYDTAIDHAVSGGFGFFRIGIDYVSPDSFSMEARIERVPNQLMVHWDVNSTKYDASDWGYSFVSDWLTEDEFKHRYPKAKPVDFQGDTRGDVADWIDGEQIRIAEYWKREEKTRPIYLLNNGRTIRHDVVIAEGRKLDLGGQVSDDEILMLYQQMMGVEIIKEREATFFDVTRRMISGAEVLSEDPWPGSMIPICPVWGEEVFADGRRHFRSMIRDAKDPQTMFNFWRSASTELVALAPRAPWVGPQGFVPKGHEEKWQSANTRSHAFLEYDPTAGNMPQRQPFAGVPAGVVQEALNAADDIKSVTGMYDASIGARSNETSGKAIFARQRESDNANFHFIDNLNRAIRYAGRCLLEIIPAVYSERETIRILGEDQREKVIKLTQEDGGGQLNPETGERELFNLAIGDYDVDVTAGPSYATQREETREFLTEFVRAAPSLLPIVGDVLLDHFDFQGSDVIAERLRALNQAQQAPQGAPQGPGQPGQAPGGPGIPPQV